MVFNEHISEDGPTVFAHACKLGAEGIVSKQLMRPINRVRTLRGSRFATLPALPRSESGVELE